MTSERTAATKCCFLVYHKPRRHRATVECEHFARLFLFRSLPKPSTATEGLLLITPCNNAQTVSDNCDGRPQRCLISSRECTQRCKVFFPILRCSAIFIKRKRVFCIMRNCKIFQVGGLRH